MQPQVWYLGTSGTSCPARFVAGLWALWLPCCAQRCCLPCCFCRRFLRGPQETPFFLPSTIGKLEPSYVIRKFLDAQRIHNLTAYLQTLHLQSLANADHTTLLLNCYTKLKDIAKLEEFIKVGWGRGAVAAVPRKALGARWG